MKIWVLYHGKIEADDPEAYESLRLKEEAEKIGASLDILNPENFDLVLDTTNEWRALYNGKHIETPDLILPRTGAETSLTAFSVLRFYESLKVPVINSTTGIESVADKLQTQQILVNKGFPVPRTILGKFPPDIDLVENKLGFPVVVKTLRGTRGGGVFLCETREKFKDLTDLIHGANSSSNVHFLFQQYIGYSHGRDVRVFVVGGKVLACMERRATDGSFKSNISRGGAGQPYPVTPEIRELALNVSKALNLEVTGIDLLFDEAGGYRICEANSSPGFKGLESACGVNAAAAIIRHTIFKACAHPVQSFFSRFHRLRAAA